jgi:ABC-type cobalamin/Fe3+-siderophores transport system ATPase subunit
MPPRLACSHLRIDVGGAPAIDGLTMQSTGDHVLVIGAARALFEGAAGLRPVARGELLVGGRAARDAIGAGTVACAPLDPPLPGAWRVAQYIAWSARLMGHGRATATALSDEALARMQLAGVAGGKLASASLSVRRATVIAAALATGATTLLLDDPVAGLPDDVAHALARATIQAHKDRSTVTFVGHVRLESPLALAADEAIVVEGSSVAAQGAPAEIAVAEGTLSLRVGGDVTAFQRAIEERGGHVVVTDHGPPPMHMRVDLGPLAARDLFCLAARSDAVVVELRPLARAFA